jgi:hypothetical protein
MQGQESATGQAHAVRLRLSTAASSVRRRRDTSCCDGMQPSFLCGR